MSFRRRPSAIVAVIGCLLATVGSCFLFGCSARKAQDEGTQRMAARLELIASESTGDPGVYDGRSGIPADGFGNAVYKARERLRSGHTENAIERLEALLDGGQVLSPDASYRLRNLLAVAYLRLGEQENCMHNPGAEACILPFSEQAVHRAQRGSREAARILADLLRERPDDLSARWLLNIAHMTLGSHPDSVPGEWTIAPELLQPERRIEPFRDVAPARGINTIGLAGGSVTEDFDGDGDLDILATSSGIRDAVRYYVNDGTASFTERTREAGLEGITGGLNAVHADYNNDGRPDVFVLRGGWWGSSGLHPNSLLRNNGDGTFSDVTEAAGLLAYQPTQTAAWGDYNNDGWLDLYVGNESSDLFGRPCALYRNNGDGTFTDVAAETGVAFEGYVKGVVWGDYNNDGRADLFVSNFGGENALYRNDGPVEADGQDDRPHDAGSRSWQFTNVARQAGVADHAWSFPAWFWDYDNDGWQDLLVLPFDVGILRGDGDALGAAAAEVLGTPVGVERPRLYRNEGDGTFSNRTAEAGLDRALFAMGSNFGDVNNDGHLDVYVGTGAPDFRALFPNRMFVNDGGHFEDATPSARLGHLQKGHGVSFADLDNDGDQDIFTVIGGTYTGDTFQNALFENSGNDNRWISLKLEGAPSNRSAIGARLKLTVESAGRTRHIYAAVNTGGSFGSSSLRQEIGLGSAERLQRIEVQWPASGKTDVYENVAMNRPYLVREGARELVRLDSRSTSVSVADSR